MVLTGAGVVNDARAVLFALKHPKAGVRGRAARLLPEVVTDPDFSVESEIALMSYHCRRQLLRSILNTYRQDWAERVLPLVFDRWGAQETSLLLAVCSEETVRSRLHCTERLRVYRNHKHEAIRLAALDIWTVQE